MGTNDTQGSAAGSFDHRLPPGTGRTSASETDMPDRVQQMAAGAHESVDRLARKMAPAAQKLQDELDDAGEMLHERTEQMRQWGRAWREGLRSSVREHPLTTVAAALALGLLLARLSR